MEAYTIGASDLAQLASPSSPTQLGGRRSFAATPKRKTVALGRPRAPGSDAAGTAPGRRPGATALSLSPLVVREVAPFLEKRGSAVKLERGSVDARSRPSTPGRRGRRGRSRLPPIWGLDRCQPEGRGV